MSKNSPVNKPPPLQPPTPDLIISMQEFCFQYFVHMFVIIYIFTIFSNVIYCLIYSIGQWPYDYIIQAFNPSCFLVDLENIPCLTKEDKKRLPECWSRVGGKMWCPPLLPKLSPILSLSLSLSLSITLPHPLSPSPSLSLSLYFYIHKENTAYTTTSAHPTRGLVRINSVKWKW